MSEPVWRPDPARAAQTQIAGMAGRYGYEGTDAVDRLWQRSIDDPETFWQAVWDLGDVRYSQPATAVLENAGAMPGARWFPGAKLNFAENLLRRDDDTQAIVFRGEDGSRRVMSWHRPAAGRDSLVRHCAPTALASAIVWPATCPTYQRRSRSASSVF